MSTVADAKEIPTPTTKPSVHPNFADQTGDVVLRSSDDTLFYTHSLLLSQTSKWFRGMFTLPQRPLPDHEPVEPNKSGLPLPETISVSESAKVLAGLLGVASGLQLGPWSDIDHLNDILCAAEKYEMPHVITTVRIVLSSLTLLGLRPVRVYGIAYSRGWTEEMQLAAGQAVTNCDLLSDAGNITSDLEKADGVAAVKLMLLQRRRRDGFRTWLKEITKELHSTCSSCKCSLDHKAWRNLTEVWSQMDVIPANFFRFQGDSRPLLYKVIDSECPDCHLRLYNSDFFVERLGITLSSLPHDVSVAASSKVL
ncbi:hypothetical protein BDW22DRAFT_109455 [Trametopsis cervina]|nr:hypothetical protein BDW22DRAFT_109455 [Trametopsis cervina]